MLKIRYLTINVEYNQYNPITKYLHLMLIFDFPFEFIILPQTTKNSLGKFQISFKILHVILPKNLECYQIFFFWTAFLHWQFFF